MDGSTFSVMFKPLRAEDRSCARHKLGYETMAITIKADDFLFTVNKLCGTNYDEEKRKGEVITINDDGSITISAENNQKKNLLID